MAESQLQAGEKAPSEVDKVSRRRKRILTINLMACKYQSVKRMARRFGFKISNESSDVSLLWSDCSISIDKSMEIKPYQKINHFPGMNEICRKDSLARNMNRMRKLFPADYHFFPRTWCLPADFSELESYAQSKKNMTFIVKPDNGAQGKGIFLTRNVKGINRGEHVVCQQYIGKPFLLDGFKFDFRLYVLVTSCDPLRICVYKDGLARFATTAYHQPVSSNMSDVYMHLTNYAINKRSENFIRDDDSGSKRRISSVMHCLQEKGYDVERIWIQIEDVIIKTLISCHPALRHNYASCFPHRTPDNSACFEILGFDVMLDYKLKPWLLEVNLSPSFHTDAPLDKDLKESLLCDALNLIPWHVMSKRKYAEQQRKLIEDRSINPRRSKMSVNDHRRMVEKLASHEERNMGHFRRVYPKDNYEELYLKYFQQSAPSLCAGTIASKARQTLIMQQRSDIESKQKEAFAVHSHGKISKKKAHPESPTGSRKLHRTLVHKESVKRTVNAIRSQELPPKKELQPFRELEREELQRMSEMQQRDSLVRGLGIPELLQDMMSSSQMKHFYSGSQVACSLSNKLDVLSCHDQLSIDQATSINKVAKTSLFHHCEEVRQKSMNTSLHRLHSRCESQSAFVPTHRLKGRSLDTSSPQKTSHYKLTCTSKSVYPLLLCTPAPMTKRLTNY